MEIEPKKSHALKIDPIKFQINKLLIPSSSIYVNSYESGWPFPKAEIFSKTSAGPLLKLISKRRPDLS